MVPEMGRKTQSDSRWIDRGSSMATTYIMPVLQGQSQRFVTEQCTRVQFVGRRTEVNLRSIFYQKLGNFDVSTKKINKTPTFTSQREQMILTGARAVWQLSLPVLAVDRAHVIYLYFVHLLANMCRAHAKKRASECVCVGGGKKEGGQLTHVRCTNAAHYSHNRRSH